MGVCEYNNKYERVKRNKVDINVCELGKGRMKVADGKNECFEIYRKSRGITVKEMADVIGMTEKEFRAYFYQSGVNQVVIDIVYILTGEDISYMKKEWV